MLDRKRRVKTTISPPLTFNLKVDFTFSVPSLKGERQFDFLLNKLIDKDLHLLNKLIDKNLQ